MSNSNVCKLGLLMALTLAAVIVSTTLTEPATARARYTRALSSFYEHSPQASVLIKSKRCGVCHAGYLEDPKPKKWAQHSNAFGREFGKALAQENGRSAEVLKKAVSASVEAKNAEGQTYGSLLEAGQLPTDE